jgi:bacillithiol biosynthesis cysteine-adding enzyme BshC
MRTLPVRARVEASPEPPFDRLFDAVVHDLVHDGPLAQERFATRWRDRASLTALAESKRAPLDAALARELEEYHRRLGAPPESLSALARLARGDAVCTVSGQQPAPLLGPLYSLHKVASSVGLADAVARRTSVPCVPLHWMHGEDSDFAEIRSVTVADAQLALHDLELPSSAHHEGGLVGGIRIEPLRALCAAARAHWNGLPGEAATGAVLGDALERARDLGELQSAVLLALFGARGLVVVDPRLPAFRAAARRVIDRYLDRAPALHEAARRAGAVLEARTQRRPLADPALESFVFAIRDGARVKCSIEEARALPPSAALAPSVALRPAVQDGVLPTVAMACGPGELAYLAQLREVFEGLDVRAACPVPRLSVTWLPAAATALLDASGSPPFDFVVGADAALKRVAEARVPEAARATLDRARRAALEGLDAVGRAAAEVDASLPQMVASARAKVDYQFARLEEGLVGKVRHRLERQHPEWARVRYVLLPGDRLQERRLASLEPVARRGPEVVNELCDLAGDAARELESGRHVHLLVEMP